MADSTPATTSSFNDSMAAEWALARALLGGTPSMREAATAYLPAHEHEEDDQYKARLANTYLLNEFERAILNASSKPFSKPMNVETTDADLDLIVKDVDLLGTGISIFGRGLFEDSTAMTTSWIFVDYPRGGENMTLADQAGDRPYWQLIRAEEVIAVYWTVVDGLPHISHARILVSETVKEEDGWGEATVQRVLVMEPGEWEYFKEVDGEWVSDGGPFTVSIDVVPLVPFETGRRVGAGTTKGVFSDLAWKNVEHWNSSSEQRVALKYGRFPLLTATGVRLPTKTDDNTPALIVGPGRMLNSETVGAEFKYIEPPGQSVEAGFKDLDMIELSMRLLSLRPSLPKTGYLTATSRMLDESQANSAIQNMTIRCAGAIDKALRMTARWLGREVDVEVNINTDYSMGDDDGELEHLFKMWTDGALSTETLYEECIRRGVLGEGFSVEEELDRLGRQGTTPPITPEPGDED